MKTKKLKPKSITIIGKIWRDKLYGNNYSSADVFFDGQLVAETLFSYGDYEQAAWQELKDKGLVKFKDYEAAWSFCERNKIKLLSTKSSCLKRELKTKRTLPCELIK